MKTAEELMKEEWSKYPDEHIDITSVAGVLLLQHIIKKVMKDYAKLAISADRENVANHAKTKRGRYQHYVVDKDSIINAPFLNLE